jgi:hypothetical protein
MDANIVKIIEEKARSGVYDRNQKKKRKTQPPPRWIDESAKECNKLPKSKPKKSKTKLQPIKHTELSDSDSDASIQKRIKRVIPKSKKMQIMKQYEQEELDNAGDFIDSSDDEDSDVELSTLLPNANEHHLLNGQAIKDELTEKRNQENEKRLADKSIRRDNTRHEMRQQKFVCEAKPFTSSNHTNNINININQSGATIIQAHAPFMHQFGLQSLFGQSHAMQSQQFGLSRNQFSQPLLVNDGNSSVEFALTNKDNSSVESLLDDLMENPSDHRWIKKYRSACSVWKRYGLKGLSRGYLGFDPALSDWYSLQMSNIASLSIQKQRLLQQLKPK